MHKTVLFQTIHLSISIVYIQSNGEIVDFGETDKDKWKSG